VEIFAQWTSAGVVEYAVSEVKPGARYSSAAAPQIGDRIVEINGRAMKDWQNENFEFCKFPLKAQCDNVLTENLFDELLSWSHADQLTYTLDRNGRTWKIPVSVNRRFSAHKSDLPGCTDEANRYSGFVQTYSGQFACIYESLRRPNEAILRISSFYYPDPKARIGSVRAEVDRLYPWWKQHATWSQLIIDVIDNHGGDAPIPYYEILLQNDFQEQYVEFKKIPEMEDAKLRSGIFWNTEGQEIWFQDQLKSGAWAAIPMGGFSLPVPMFCALSGVSCDQGLFPVRKHPFRGRVDLLVNQWCVSSCDGFVFNIKERFGASARVFGQPQAADTGFSRLSIDLSADSHSPAGFMISIEPDADRPSELFSQTVVITRSVTHGGLATAGQPVFLDGFVPLTLDNRDRWPEAVLDRALNSN
jgi:hypothetical protein